MTAGQVDQPRRYAVVLLEFESDAPGVVLAEGPYTTWEQASTSADDFAAARGLTRGADVQVCQLYEPGQAPGGDLPSPPGTITFEHDGTTYHAVVGLPQQGVASDAMVVDYGGVRYAISIALGAIPNYPGVGYIARPVQPVQA